MLLITFGGQCIIYIYIYRTLCLNYPVKTCLDSKTRDADCSTNRENKFSAYLSKEASEYNKCRCISFHAAQWITIGMHA